MASPHCLSDDADMPIGDWMPEMEIEMRRKTVVLAMDEGSGSQILTPCRCSLCREDTKRLWEEWHDATLSCLPAAGAFSAELREVFALAIDQLTNSRDAATGSGPAQPTKTEENTSAV